MKNDNLKEKVRPNQPHLKMEKYVGISAQSTSANSRLVLQDLKSMVEPPICKTVSSGL